MDYKELVKKMLQDDYKLIKYCNDDEELAMAAFTRNSEYFFKLLSDRLKEMPKFAVKCHDWYYIPAKLQMDKDFFVEYMKENENAINRHSIRDIFRYSDDETIKKILTTEGLHNCPLENFFKCGFDKWENNKEIVLLLIKKFPRQYDYITNDLKYDIDIMKEMLEQYKYHPFAFGEGDELEKFPYEIQQIIKERMKNYWNSKLENVKKEEKELNKKIAKLMD